jgi:hypothetical protein
LEHEATSLLSTSTHFNKESIFEQGWVFWLIFLWFCCENLGLLITQWYVFLCEKVWTEKISLFFIFKVKIWDHFLRFLYQNVAQTEHFNLV